MKEGHPAQGCCKSLTRGRDFCQHLYEPTDIARSVCQVSRSHAFWLYKNIDRELMIPKTWQSICRSLCSRCICSQGEESDKARKTLVQRQLSLDLQHIQHTCALNCFNSVRPISPGPTMPTASGTIPRCAAIVRPYLLRQLPQLLTHLRQLLYSRLFTNYACGA